MKDNLKTNPSQRIRQEINKDIEVIKIRSPSPPKEIKYKDKDGDQVFLFYVFMVTTLLRSQAVQRNKKKTRMTACDLTSTLYSSFYIFLGPRYYSKY